MLPQITAWSFGVPMRYRVLLAFLPVLCGGCAAMFHGSRQPITVMTDLPGATCNLFRDGVPLGQVPGGGTIEIEKSKDVLTVRCDKLTYETGYAQINAQDDPLIGLDVLLLPIALVFDEVVGSAHFYQPSVHVPMGAHVRLKLDRRDNYQHLTF